MNLKTTISVTMILLCIGNAVAAESSNETDTSDWQVILQLDNDLFAGSDRDYTNGIRVGIVQEFSLESEKGQRLNKRLRGGAKQLQDRLQSIRLDDEDNLRFARGFGLTQLIFTPENPLALSSPEGERPYAGWLGLEYSLHVKADNLVNSLTLSLGTTGEASLAQPAQDWVHRNISGSPIFQGWDSQVPSEVTLNVNFDHKQRFRRLSKNISSHNGLEIDGYYEAGIAAGNFRSDAYVGSLARIGYRLPSNFATPRVQIGSYGHQLFTDQKDYGNKFSAFAFAGVRASAVLHDITLDGPVFRDFDTGVESEPLVGELIYGLGLRYRKIDLLFSQTVRSEEFVGQTENLKFGSFMVRFQTGWF